MKSKTKNRKEFCEEIFPNLGERIEAGFRDRDINENWSKWVHKRAIICARNDDCQEINRICVDMMKGKPHVYRSADKVRNPNAKAQAVPTEFLNSQTPSGCPDHCIVLISLILTLYLYSNEQISFFLRTFFYHLFSSI